MFKLLQAVTITHPLFEGCVGQVVGAGLDSGQMKIEVDFIDIDDKINKRVYFEEKHLKKRVLKNG